jgi:hypothetical protein
VVEEPRLEGQVLLERLLVAIKTETQTLWSDQKIGHGIQKKSHQRKSKGRVNIISESQALKVTSKTHSNHKHLIVST